MRGGGTAPANDIYEVSVGVGLHKRTVDVSEEATAPMIERVAGFLAEVLAEYPRLMQHANVEVRSDGRSTITIGLSLPSHNQTPDEVEVITDAAKTCARLFREMTGE